MKYQNLLNFELVSHQFLLPERNVFVLHFMGVFIYEACGHSNQNKDVSRRFKKILEAEPKEGQQRQEEIKHIAIVHCSVSLHIIWCLISCINGTFISHRWIVKRSQLLATTDPRYCDIRILWISTPFPLELISCWSLPSHCWCTMSCFVFFFGGWVGCSVIMRLGP